MAGLLHLVPSWLKSHPLLTGTAAVIAAVGVAVPLAVATPGIAVPLAVATPGAAPKPPAVATAHAKSATKTIPKAAWSTNASSTKAPSTKANAVKPSVAPSKSLNSAPSTTQRATRQPSTPVESTSTPAQASSPNPAPTTPTRTSSGGFNAIPSRVAAAYWTTWDSLSLPDVSKSYNLLFIFSATPSGGTAGSVSLSNASQLKADVQARRAEGTCMLLTVGGEGVNIPLTTPAASTAFVNSIESIYSQIGGFDGVDFDLENAADINATQLVSIAQQLKAHFGTGFNITWAGADPSWITNGPAAVEAMIKAGVFNMVDIMDYDWGISAESAKITYAEQEVSDWVSVTGNANIVCIGIELPNADDAANNEFGTPASAITLWNWALTKYPVLRGMDIWNAYEDARSSGGSSGEFVSDVIPAVMK